MQEDHPCVCVVDDDQSTRESLSNLLRSTGLNVQTFASAHEFLTRPRPAVPSCLVLDVQLPGLSGLDLQLELAKRHAPMPIIFLSGHGDIPMTVRAMKAGAIDFLTKPFRDQDLLHAVEQALHRARQMAQCKITPAAAQPYAADALHDASHLHRGGGRMQEFPPFRLDPVNQCLWRRRDTAEDERVLLTPKGFAVLCYLVVHAGQLVTQEALLAAVWPETHVQPEVLKSRIFEIRGVLGDRAQTPQFIETLPRRGYRFIAPVHDAPAAASTHPQPPVPSLLVGRAGALETLWACLQHALQGQRQLVWVTGEPGIGKTALVDAFV